MASWVVVFIFENNVALRVIRDACRGGRRPASRDFLGLESLFDVYDCAVQRFLVLEYFFDAFFVFEGTESHVLNFGTSIGIGKGLFVGADDVVSVSTGK